MTGDIEKTGSPWKGVLTRDFVLAWVASFLFMASAFLLIPLLPLYMVDVAGATTTQVGFLMGVLTFTSFALRPLVGRKSDTWGRRPLLLAGAADFMIAPPMYIFARSVWILPLVLSFHGAGLALYHTTSLTFVGDIAPESRRGQSMAWFQSSFNLAIMVGPLLGECVKDRFGFNAVFIAASAASAFSLVLMLLVPESRVLTVDSSSFWHGAKKTRRLLVLIAFAIFPAGATLGSLEAFLALFAEAEGIPRFALFFTISAGLIIVLRLSCGWALDRFGRRISASLALSVLCVSMFLVATVESFGGLCLAAAFYGAGFAFVFPSLSALLVDRSPPESLGLAFGITTAAFEGGMVFGSIAMGPIVSSMSYGAGYSIIGLVCLASAIFYFFSYGPLAGGVPGDGQE